MNTADSTHGTTASDAAGTPGPTSGSQASSSAPSEAPVLTVRGLTKTYGSGETEVDAVRSVDLDVASGEVLLVMGPSGSGKTTLLLMLGALLRPTGGSITVTGRDRRDVDIAAAPEKQLPALRSHTFGFIFQDYALLDALTATENVAVAANLAGATGSAAHHRATELLDRVGLAHRASARPSQMSGGEQQRVAVARALSNDPPVLLADEPTANLDASRGRDLARLLRRLADEDHRSVLIVSHDERLREIADRVLWLEDGQFRQIAAMAIDPVCGMSVEPTGAHLEWNGQTIWFCSEGCKRDLTDAEAKLSADAEPARTTPLAPQVVQGLDTYAELASELGQGQDRAKARLGGCCGRRADQVCELCRGRPRPPQIGRGRLPAD